MKLGKQLATIQEAGLTKTAAGEPQAFIRFRTETGDDVMWRQQLKTEKNKEIAMENALRVGFTGEGWSDFGDRTVDREKQFEIFVQEREYNNKKYIDVKYISNPRSVTAMSPDEAAMKLASSKDEFALYRAKHKLAATKPTDDIPF